MHRRVIAGVMGLVGVATLSTVTGPLEREAGACSCRGPQMALVGPDRVDDAPLNARVRIEVPAGEMTTVKARTVLRVHRGGEVAASSRIIAPGGSLSVIELIPAAPLASGTQYEIATVDPAQVPPATVIGTFRTGTAADTSAPRIDALGAAIAFKNLNAMGSMCQVSGPWVIIEGVRAEDPGRPAAQLVFGIWLADAAGNVDTKKPPTALVSSQEGTLRIGQRSLCDPRAFPIPKSPSMQLGIAALDEAGNASAVRRVRVDLAGARIQ
jgi:hypothetical protein